MHEKSLASVKVEPRKSMANVQRLVYAQHFLSCPVP